MADTWFTHSAKSNFENPTWPTEWRQFTPLIAYEDYMRTGSLELFQQYEEYLALSTQRNCIDGTSHLVNFTNCERSCHNDTSSCRDIIDWPEDTRDGYVLSDVSTVINAFAIAGLRAMAVMARESGYENRTYDEEASELQEGMKTFYGVVRTEPSLMVRNVHIQHGMLRRFPLGWKHCKRHQTHVRVLEIKSMAGSVYGVGFDGSTMLITITDTLHWTC